MPPSRSNNTCSQCRARKVRCRGGPDVCANCRRLQFHCSFGGHDASTVPQDTAPLPAQDDRPAKKRQSRACLQCRAGKSKCSGEHPACASCRDRAKPCTYPETKRSRRDDCPNMVEASSHTSAASGQPSDGVNVSPVTASFMASHSATGPTASENMMPRSHVSSAGSASWIQSAFNSMDVDALLPEAGRVLSLPPLREQLQLINDFFRHIHPLPAASFLNELSITHRCLASTLDPVLLRAICSISAMSLKYNKYYPVQTTVWVQEAENTIWQTIERPTVFKTQALLLIVLYHMEIGNFEKAYMLLSMVSRFASALRLHYERIDLSHLSQEIRRRLMWSVMLVDSYFSIGLPEAETCTHEFTYLKLPCAEEDFHTEHPPSFSEPSLEPEHQLQSPSMALDGVQEAGLLELYIRQAMLKRDIMKFTRHALAQGHISAAQLIAAVDGLYARLHAVKPWPYDSSRLEGYKRSRWLLRYVINHLSWHQCYCDLKRLFLSGYREAAPDAVLAACPPEYVHKAAATCLEHAQEIIRVLSDLDNLRVDIVAVPLDIVIGGYHASRLLLFLSRSSLLPAGQNIMFEDAYRAAVQMLTTLRRLEHNCSVTMQHTVRDLESVIDKYSQSTHTRTRESSDEEEQMSGRTQQPRYARAVQRHKSLGVHSALRRARFDDESSDTMEMDHGTALSVQAASLLPAAARGCPETPKESSGARGSWPTAQPRPQCPCGATADDREPLRRRHAPQPVASTEPPARRRGIRHGALQYGDVGIL
ncbi:alkaline-phosphatase-like protein [Penicillium argentinense]|uniref:Alkaline-phosphatase-like protein n=1 Tax=Penicillium argentinense TaxID=1131581 RepID=A0A9W9G4E0_9EURO|nr:alkaline-phosphatase-like protein [Penicillium argentinense]KAJ5111969.1 alkaline-phosphatase-like protein [Penicillium argentinense]